MLFILVTFPLGGYHEWAMVLDRIWREMTVRSNQMANQDTGIDAWLLILVAAIFVSGIAIYVGFDQVDVWLRKLQLFLNSLI